MASKFKIIKTAPMKSLKKSRESIYPFKQMKIGDSFIVPEKQRDGVNSCIQLRRKETAHRYSTRTVKNGVQVWRVKPK